MLKIVHIPNPVLTTPSKPVTVFDNKLQKLLKDMVEALDACVDPQGVGLAAPQVGIGQQIFIMKPTEDAAPKAYINPKIIETQTLPETPMEKKKRKEGSSLEGCLSIPRIWSPVTRPNRVLLEYQDATGETHTEWFSGFEAVIVQHEVDHLQGILFTQRAIEQNSQLYEEKQGELVKVKGL